MCKTAVDEVFHFSEPGGVSQHLLSGCHIVLEVAPAPRRAEERHRPRRRCRKWPVVVKS